MQDRRYRPGDVLDDYCPRERRITDHAIVAMIDDEIRRTRCGVCDAEHEYKEGKVPAPRRKTQPPALFTQVLEGLNGPSAPHPVAVPEPAVAASPAGVNGMAAVATAAKAIELPAPLDPAFIPENFDELPPATPALARKDSDDVRRDKPVETDESVEPDEPGESGEPEETGDGGFRRSLIRATFPRPEGQAPPQRSAPEFTIQSLHNRRNGQRQANGQNKFRGGGGGRRRPGGGNLDHIGPMRFRDHGHGQGQGQGNNNQGQGQGQGQGGGRRRRGGKKNR